MQNPQKKTQARPRPVTQDQEKTKKVKVTEEKHTKVQPKKQVVPEEKVKDVKKDLKEQAPNKTHKEQPKEKKAKKNVEVEEEKVGIISSFFQI